MKTVTVQYFALLREQAGVEAETLTTKAGTLSELFEELSLKHNFTLTRDLIQVAVNDEFSRLSNSVDQGSRIVFIPPVAGG